MQKVALINSRKHTQITHARSGQTEPGLVAFYDICQEMKWVYSFNRRARTGCI